MHPRVAPPARLTRERAAQVCGRSDAFALRVQGTSMIDALIGDGDIVILDPAQSCDDGEMVAVWLSYTNETTLKKLFHENGRRAVWC